MCEGGIHTTHGKLNDEKKEVSSFFNGCLEDEMEATALREKWV